MYHENKRARAREKELRRALRRALTQIDHLVWTIGEEMSAAGPDQVAGNSNLRRHERRMVKASRVLRELVPLTKKKQRA